jgi:RNase P protein component
MFQKTKKPKYKVVIVKMKDAGNVTHSAKFKKALDLMMNAKEEDLASNR